MAKGVKKTVRKVAAKKPPRASASTSASVQTDVTVRWPQDSAFVWVLFALLFIAGALMSEWGLALVGLLVIGIVIILTTHRHGGGSVPEQWLGKEAAQRVGYLIGAALILVGLWQLVSWS